jgi:hypothetical protein
MSGQGGPHKFGMLPARPTIYRGVRMRSRLEADFARWLDGRGVAWNYEPDCFADGAGQYLPDFQVVHPGRAPIFVELKPQYHLDRGDVLSSFEEWLARMEIIWSSQPDATLALIFWAYQDGADLRFFAQPSDRAWWIVDAEGKASPWWTDRIVREQMRGPA